MGPVSVVRKLILGKAPFLKFLLGLFGYAGIIGHKIEQPFLVILVLLDNFLSAFIAGFGVVIIHPNVVRAKRAVVIRVRFSIGNNIKLLKPFIPSGVKYPDQQLILSGIIIVRSRKGDPVVGMVGHTGPE